MVPGRRCASWLTPRIVRTPAYDVGFLGACYGRRQEYVAALRGAGLSVVTGGHGWPDGKCVSLNQMGEFLASARVILGMGGMGYSDRLTTLKGRDFEVPGAAGAYLTTFNPELADWFDIGREICCYHSQIDMVDLAVRLVRDSEALEDLKGRAYVRSMREHRWIHRFEFLLRELGVLASSGQPANCRSAEAVVTAARKL